MSDIQSGLVTLRQATLDDLKKLGEIEHRCFSNDRLSERRMRYYIGASHARLIVATLNGEVMAYALLLLRQGTQLTRLYSIAVLPQARGNKLAEKLINDLEQFAVSCGKHFMRLEVSENNVAAISVYERLGFKRFGIYTDYYEDHSDALRMQKVLRFSNKAKAQDIYPWYRQTTEFTCGPAALMMAMKKLSPEFDMRQQTELDLWRRATTIYMTSGHGGCHPIGLALAAHEQGYQSEVWLNQALPLFVEGVRNQHKKDIITLVESHFEEQANRTNVPVKKFNWGIADLEAALKAGGTVVCLISTYPLAKLKAPHWVAVTHVDDKCFYLHDSDPTTYESHLLEFQHIPVAREDFLRFTCYGKRKIRSAIVLFRPDK
ncbi:GNAT family N-acetyltransferase/peptidase C39 family protein [Alteromonas sp. ASW11-130]|uniref:GNAT family N-acetyltransferase/peptidase C39 family protein n=1 Tax=Alteromonas sp. ASW11-130 TaxID=3015775 RepID=UPI00224270F2|nr:GNAT family N-acetyltransferase/peptidase C39 family protein [Alteromonas sp. ASW11-130]MCW8091361.1 GNAT family N-acetyltransferase/peptidase C39 family protein [Alteromonas sp. ASW11-130]